MHCCVVGHPSGVAWFCSSFSCERLVLEMGFEEEMFDLAKKMTRKIKIEQHVNMTFRLTEDWDLVLMFSMNKCNNEGF